jgi:SWI/SNF-related matrix-associated actin-dependent regulator 1 of chromatin subfamily A
MSFHLVPLDAEKVRVLLEEEADLSEAVLPDAKEWLSGRKSLRAKDLNQAGDERPLIAQLTELRQKIALMKLPSVIELAENILEAGEKLVLFGVHKAVITELLSGLQKWNPVSITGDTPPNRRQEYVNAFQQDAQCRLIAGNIEAMGVGYTLTEASNVLFAEILLGRPKLISQAIERCCRIGQKNAVVARFPVFENSVDQWMLQSMVRAENSIEKVMA